MIRVGKLLGIKMWKSEWKIWSVKKCRRDNILEIYGVIGGRWQAQRICRVEMIWCRKLRIYQLDGRHVRDLHLRSSRWWSWPTFWPPPPLTWPIRPNPHLKFLLMATRTWTNSGEEEYLCRYICMQHCCLECVTLFTFAHALTLQRTFTKTSSLAPKNIITSTGKIFELNEQTEEDKN